MCSSLNGDVIVKRFPSPCGGKLKCPLRAAAVPENRGFRPLAGRTLSVTANAVPAPPKGELNIGVNGSRKSSPFGRAGAQRLRGFCGDKLKSYYPMYPKMEMEFPSPCGDKLKYMILYGWQPTDLFPSPCGDKLKCHRDGNKLRGQEVSVPLRG